MSDARDRVQRFVDAYDRAHDNPDAMILALCVSEDVEDITVNDLRALLAEDGVLREQGA